MFLLLDDRNKIKEISNMAIRLEDDTIKIADNLIIGNKEYVIVEVDNVPIEIIPEKYFYIDGEYTLNTNYIDDSMIAEYEQRVSTLQELNATLEEKANVQDNMIAGLQDMIIMISNNDL